MTYYIKEAGIYFFQWQIENIVDLHLTHLGRTVKIKIFLFLAYPSSGPKVTSKKVDLE